MLTWSGESHWAPVIPFSGIITCLNLLFISSSKNHDSFNLMTTQKCLLAGTLSSINAWEDSVTLLLGAHRGCYWALGWVCTEHTMQKPSNQDHGQFLHQWFHSIKEVYGDFEVQENHTICHNTLDKRSHTSFGPGLPEGVQTTPNNSLKTQPQFQECYKDLE